MWLQMESSFYEFLINTLVLAYVVLQTDSRMYIYLICLWTGSDVFHTVAGAICMGSMQAMLACTMRTATYHIKFNRKTSLLATSFHYYVISANCSA